MSLRIVTYDRVHLEGMVALYNAETAFEPHIAPLTPGRFTELVEAKSCFDPAGLFLALDGGGVAGWVHACIAAGTEPWHDPGKSVASIRMLIYPRERLEVGAALVAEATAWLRATGKPELEAASARSGYPFYRGLWMGGEPMGPASMPHVQLAFEVGGYKTEQESIFMVGELGRQRAATTADVPIALIDSPAQMAHEPMRESWVGFEPMRVRALLDGEEVGSLGWAVLPHVAERLGAPCVSIWSLGVREQHRRQGIGSALVSHCLERGYALGARFASVGTQLWNAPAQGLYAKHGFRPYCILVERILKVER
jgi:GNAT superfamily N-acetyltransferase